MTRCYVCRLPTSTTKVRGLDVCRGCVNAVPRVFELESRELSLVAALQRAREALGGVERKRLDTFLDDLNWRGRDDDAVDLDELRRVLIRAAEVLDPTAGKGHALERIDRDGKTPLYGCVMPGCEVCSVVGMIRDLDRRVGRVSHQ